MVTGLGSSGCGESVLLGLAGAIRVFWRMSCLAGSGRLLLAAASTNARTAAKHSSSCMTGSRRSAFQPDMAGAEPLCMRLKIFLRRSGSMMICGRNGAEGSSGLSSLLGCLSTRILLSLVVSVHSGALVRAWTPRLKYPVRALCWARRMRFSIGSESIRKLSVFPLFRFDLGWLRFLCF